MTPAVATYFVAFAAIVASCAAVFMWTVVIPAMWLEDQEREREERNRQVAARALADKGAK